MKTTLKISAAALMAGCLIFTAACKKSESGSPSTSANAPYNMYMTDAPAPYSAVNVNITGAAVYSGGVWQNLNVNAGTYNLLNLCNGKDTLLASGTVAAGAVTQVKLMLAASGHTVVVGGVTYPLSLSSSDEAGLVLNVNAQANAGANNSITIDFDAGASVVATGNSTYKLKPLLRSIVPAVTGDIKGTISPASAEAVIVASNSMPDSAFSFSSVLTGNFMVQGLAAGTYTVTIIPNPPFAIKTYTGVQVSQGSVSSLGTVSLQY